jgi:hypothetical protein
VNTGGGAPHAAGIDADAAHVNKSGGLLCGGSGGGGGGGGGSGGGGSDGGGGPAAVAAAAAATGSETPHSFTAASVPAAGTYEQSGEATAGEGTTYVQAFVSQRLLLGKSPRDILVEFGIPKTLWPYALDAKGIDIALLANVVEDWVASHDSDGGTGGGGGGGSGASSDRSSEPPPRPLQVRTTEWSPTSVDVVMNLTLDGAMVPTNPSGGRGGGGHGGGHGGGGHAHGRADQSHVVVLDGMFDENERAELMELMCVASSSCDLFRLFCLCLLATCCVQTPSEANTRTRAQLCLLHLLPLLCF